MKILIGFLILATLVSCGGKTGATGTQGAQGPQGEPGEDQKLGIRTYLESGFTADRSASFRVPCPEGFSYCYLDLSELKMIKSGVAQVDAEDEMGATELLATQPIDLNKGLILARYYLIGTNNATGFGEIYGGDDNRTNPHYFVIDFNSFDQAYPNGFALLDVINYVDTSTEVFKSMMEQNLFTNSSSPMGGTTYYFETNTDSSKDLEANGAKIEKMEVENLKETLISYGMSEERTEKLADLAVAYKKINSKRALNDREKDIFTKELMGLNFDQASKEMVEDYEGLIEKAAEKNGVSPEAIKDLLSKAL